MEDHCILHILLIFPQKSVNDGLVLPAIFCALVTFLLTKLNVEKANKTLLAQRNTQVQ